MFAAYSEKSEADLTLVIGEKNNAEESKDFEKWLSNSSFPSSSKTVPGFQAVDSAAIATQHDVDQTNKRDFSHDTASRSDCDDSSDRHDFRGSSSSGCESGHSKTSKRERKRSKSKGLRKSSKVEKHERRRRSREKSGKYEREKVSRRSRSPNTKKHHFKRKKDGSRRWSRQDSKGHEEHCSCSSSYSDQESKKEDRLRHKENSTSGSENYYDDRKRDFGNFKVQTLSRPSVALYHPFGQILGLKQHHYSKKTTVKKTLKHRYYNRILKYLEEQLEKSDSKKIRESSLGDSEINTISDAHRIEGELSKVTAKFNSDLTSEPQNISLWLEYVKFQDIIHQFELTHRRGGGAAGIRVTAERKLSILDKALEANPGNIALLTERCHLAEAVLPSDKLSSQLRSWVAREPGNLVLWKSLIMSTQGSLSACRVPVVKSLCQEALTTIHNLRRGNIESAVSLESKIIDLILHLGLFLRQAGLLELMWSLIQVYLEFNLAKLDPSKFNISSTVADNALIELEETILGSQMPLPTLWLRIETLRSGTHWISLPADSDCEDPQRIVFPEDINDFIHPIRTPQLTFRLVTITLVLLKVPLLPWRQSAAEAAGLHPLPWLLDGPEPLYASLLPLGTLEFRETSVLLVDAAQLAWGPQFLIARPGQDEYIDFLTQVFSACSKCFEPLHSTYILVWWLRFYRWLIQLERLGHCKLPLNRKKKMRASAKDLLRQDSNRSNLLLFKEFALLEWECCNIDSAKKVLHGAIAAQPATKPVPFSTEPAALCSLYRTLIELCLSHTQVEEPEVEQTGQKEVKRVITEKNREKALLLLVSLGRGIPLAEKKVSSTDIAAAISKFDHISRELFVNPTESEGDSPLNADVCHVAPSFIAEWTTCHGWLLYLSDSIWKASAMFEVALTSLKLTSDEGGCTEKKSDSCESPPSLLKVQREAIFEGYISLLRHHCHQTCGSFSILRDVLLRGLKEFPGNLTLLAAFADLESTVIGSGLPSWRLSDIFIKFNSAAACCLLVFEMRHRLKQQEVLARNADILLNRGGPEVPNSFLRTRMDTLLKKLTKHLVMRRCPLLWRLRLQFAAAFSNKDTDYHRTFYLALEDCPWAKALYMDIVQVLPMQLGQVQDLLIEKELRLHVTPEELEILRKDS